MTISNPLNLPMLHLWCIVDGLKPQMEQSARNVDVKSCI